MTHVREKSRFGPCYALGELIGETATRYLYRNRGWDRLRQQKLIDPPRAVHGVRGLSRARRGGLKTPPARGANKSAPGASPARREPVSGMRRLQPTSHGTLDGQANASNTSHFQAPVGRCWMSKGIKWRMCR